MDRKEKKSRKEKLSEHVNLGNGRFTDQEIERLEKLVESRQELDGSSKTYRSSYKSFDSEGTYRVNEEDIYTFHGDTDKITIERNNLKHWDDGQEDVVKETIDTARGILNLLSKIFSGD